MITVSHADLARLLEYCVHQADCELVVYRFDDGQRCTCGLVQALNPLCDAEVATIPREARVLRNGDIFGGRSMPGWLLQLVPVRYRPVSHRGRHQPSEMSDG